MFFLLSCSNEGRRISAFNLKTIDGNNISDKNLEGKITVINVWATWCGSCLGEIPELNELAQGYSQDTSVLFLALSDESEEKLKRFLLRRAFNFKQIPAAEELTNVLQTRLVKTYPQHIIIGKDMKIKFEHTGKLKNISEILGENIEKAR